ncbi:hypothetical protein IG631_12503 [Alternaria alternata]|nr:hypothetical protein IG631_12503 [Alternaria alternata]
MAVAVRRLGVAQVGGPGVGQKEAGELFLAAPSHTAALRVSPPHFSPLSFVAIRRWQVTYR